MLSLDPRRTVFTTTLEVRGHLNLIIMHEMFTNRKEREENFSPFFISALNILSLFCQIQLGRQAGHPRVENLQTGPNWENGMEKVSRPRTPFQIPKVFPFFRSRKQRSVHDYAATRQSEILPSSLLTS